MDVSDRPKLETCALCTTSARYKCPRCATPTCSLICSRKHKQDTKCSGERDKVRYVPMNGYHWGTMMRDYCYLEDIGRKVGEWGNEIVRGGYTANISTSKATNARKSSTRRNQFTGKSKRDILRAHLETLDIDIELLPAGMERRNLNQSTFDHKSKGCLLTIEFVFYPSTTLAFVSSSPPPAYKMLSHRNSLSATLLSVLQRQVSLTVSKSQKQKENIPDWIPPIVTPHPEAPDHFFPPHCYLRANTEFPHPPNVVYYHKLEPTLSLSKLLHKTSFVEFPTIHVFDPDASSFRGHVVDKSGLMVEEDQVNVTREVKRRKLNKTAGIKAVFSLIGEYGSEASSHSDEETMNTHQTGLATLETYSGSDEEGISSNTEAEEDRSGSDGDVPAEGNQLDPMRLLGVIERARSAADEDMLNWGDEWDIANGE